MNTVYRTLLLVVAATAPACSRSAAPPAPPAASETSVADWTVCGMPLSGDASSLSLRCSNLHAATQVAHSLLISPEFFAVLESQTEVYASKRAAKAGKKLVPSDVEPLLENGPPAATVNVGDAYGKKSLASTSNVSRTITVDECNHNALALECAPGTVPARLVATMVHEQIHLFSDTAGNFAFTDAGGRFKDRPKLLSYMAGNIALCLLSANADGAPDSTTAAAKCLTSNTVDASGNLQVGFADPCVAIP